MIKNIRWSSRAEEDYAGLLDFLQKTWGDKLAARFNIIVSRFLVRITSFPEAYPAAKGCYQ